MLELALGNAELLKFQKIVRIIVLLKKLVALVITLVLIPLSTTMYIYIYTYIYIKA